MSKFPLNNTVKKCAITVVCVAFLQSCSMLDDTFLSDNVEDQSNETIKTASVPTNQPTQNSDMDRILGLEADMLLLIEQLSLLSEIDENPLEGIDTTKKDVEWKVEEIEPLVDWTTKEPVKISENNTKESVLTSSRCNERSGHRKVSNGHCFPKVGLHVASIDNTYNLTELLNLIRAKLPYELLTKRTLIKEYYVNNSPLHSIRIGPFSSPNEAQSYCLQIKAQNNQCALVEFSGNILKVKN